MASYVPSGHLWNAAAAAAGTWTGQTCPSARESNTSALNLMWWYLGLESFIPSWDRAGEGFLLGSSQGQRLAGRWQDTGPHCSASCPSSGQWPSNSSGECCRGAGLAGALGLSPQVRCRQGSCHESIFFSLFQSFPGASQLAGAWGNRRPPDFL